MTKKCFEFIKTTITNEDSVPIHYDDKKSTKKRTRIFWLNTDEIDFSNLKRRRYGRWDWF